jgi:ankyrin repeat protein
VVKLLLNSGIQTSDGNSTSGNTPLMFAAGQGHAAVAKILLQHNADVHAVDSNQKTALHHTAYHDQCEIVPLLLEYGADINAVDSHNKTPLLYSAFEASVQCMHVLLDASADANVIGAEGYTVLHAAVENTAHSEVLQLPLQLDSAAAQINCLCGAACDCCGWVTPLMMCTTPAHVKLLLNAAADALKRTDTGNTCLHVASTHGYPAPVICLLIKAGIDLNAVNSSGKRAVEVAVDMGNTLIAALLTRAAQDI